MFSLMKREPPSFSGYEILQASLLMLCGNDYGKKSTMNTNTTIKHQLIQTLRTPEAEWRETLR